MANSSAQRKFEWGVEHVKALCDEASAFESAKAYELRVEPKARSAKAVEYECFAVERQWPPDCWPLMAGDALQDIRSSLEYLVYTAAGGRSGTQFPIFLDPREFQVKGLPMIRGVPAAIWTVIEQAQPFNTIHGIPAMDPLAELMRLSNLDKHRDLSTVASYVDIPWVLSSHRIEYMDVADGRPLHHDAKVVSFIAHGPKASEMDVYPDLTYQIRIEGVPLRETFSRIVARVGMIIDACEGRRELTP